MGYGLVSTGANELENQQSYPDASTSVLWFAPTRCFPLRTENDLRPSQLGAEAAGTAPLL